MTIVKLFLALLCIGLSSLGLLSVTAEESSSFAERITRMLSPDMKKDEAALKSLRLQLDQQLPPFSPGHSGLSKGFHSRFQSEQDTPLDLTIDMGESFPLDRIAVFPVQGMFRGAMIDGYGFPEHFTVELSNNADFSNIELILDSESLPMPPRPNHPRQFVLEVPTAARYVRLRILKHWTRGDGEFLSAFGEVMALSGPRNVALYSEVEGESFTTLPDWYRDHLVDGQTDLGLPVGPKPSPTNGFLSKASKGPITDKWVQMELPEIARIDEVAIMPAQPVDAPDQFGHGFPRKFRLLISEDADFDDAKVIADYSDKRFPNPGDNPVVFPAGGYSARFIRLEVTEMWHISRGGFSITLAEIQVFENGANLAIGAVVTASDVFAKKEFLHVWRPEYLVDGYSSQNRLIGLKEWLEGLEERRNVESQIAELENRIEGRVERILGWILSTAIVVIIAFIGIVGMLLARRKRALGEQQEALRARIARDLHDDLGSRLGGMRLLSESLLHSDEIPESFHQDLDLLHRSSGEATDAMRDIVWLLDTRERSLEKLRQQLKLLVPSILGSMPWEFHVDGAPDAEVDFEFRRQVVLAFRESLNNAAKHSDSPLFECRVGGDSETFWFEVHDRGTGFDEATVKKGLGLNNLRKRAETIGGTVRIESQPDAGTMVRFTAPYRRSKRHRLP